MTGPSLLHAAVDELYSSPMAEFTARRKVLAAAARQAGEREIANLIAALRKPTAAADTLNRLVRSAPDAVGELLALGADLRKAEKSLDGPTLRELSAGRRHLVADLTRLAFDITEQPNPSASVRDEVTATLNAALVDEEVADLLLSGALVTRARWDGFGSTSLPELAAVLPLEAARRSRSAAASPTARAVSRAPTPVRTTESAEPSAAEQTAARRTPEQADRQAAEAAAAKVSAEADQRRLVKAAQLAAGQAADAAASARERLAAIDRRISDLSLQLAHERGLLADAQRAVRSTEASSRAAQLALTRAGGTGR